MRIEASRHVRGPNVYLARPVRIARVQLGALTERESHEFAGFPDRLLAALPGLAEHHCAAGQPGGFVQRLREGTYFGHIAEHVAIELSGLIGREVNFGRTELAGPAGVYDVIIECPVDEPAASSVPDALLHLAIESVCALVEGAPAAFARPLDDIRARYERERPGPSTAAIAAEARRRGIPVERLAAGSLLRLGYGRHRRLVWATLSDRTSAVGVDIAGDKQLTRELLAGAGIPVPDGAVVHDLPDALALLARLGSPVVVKPRHGRQGTHVYLGVDTPETLRMAMEAVLGSGAPAVVEQQLSGRDYRVLMVGDRLVAAAERVAAHVIGDGRTDVIGLIDRANADPRRGAGHDRVLTRLGLDEVAALLLHRQGLDPGSVPDAGRVVWLRENANLSTGGTSHDVTDRVHPDVVELCRRTVAVVGLDIAGIDLRLPDIASPLPPAVAGGRPAGGVIEVNAAPGLRMHLAPTVGAHRDVGAAIVDALYPAGTPSRIPTVAITGTNGKTTVARLTAHLLAGAGLRTGLTTTDGVYIDGRLVQRADATGPRSAQVVLGDPTIDAAVLETARGGLLRHGLGYDSSDVGVITNLTPDHLGQDGVQDLDDLVRVKSLIAERVTGGGAVVLNADDARCVAVAPRCAAGRRLVWFSVDFARNPDHPVIRPHVDAGGCAYVLADGWLVEFAQRRRVPIVPVAELAGAFGGAARYAIANALAALAAARDLGVTTACAAHRLRTFGDNPGRGVMLRVGAVDVLVDYAHNPAAFDAVGEMMHRVWGARRTIAVVTLPGDRSDDLLRRCARVLARRFDRIVLYEDRDRRGRSPGEVPALVHDEIMRRRPDAVCATVTTVEDATRAALRLAEPGDVVLLVYEQVEPVLVLLDALGARPVRDWSVLSSRGATAYVIGS